MNPSTKHKYSAFLPPCTRCMLYIAVTRATTDFAPAPPGAGPAARAGGGDDAGGGVDTVTLTVSVTLASVTVLGTAMIFVLLCGRPRLPRR